MLIDSTFAVDSYLITLPKKKIKVGNTHGQIVEAFDIKLDSLSFGGRTYPMTRCLVMDMVDKFQQYTPKCIIGGNVLKKDIWCFNLKDNKISLCKMPIKEADYTLRWKSVKGMALNAIHLKAKIAGKKTIIFFDTGSTRNILPLNMDITPTTKIETKGADIANKFQKRKTGLCKNLSLEFAHHYFLLDFIVKNDNAPRINTLFLQNKTFALDYQKRRLYVFK